MKTAITARTTRAINPTTLLVAAAKIEAAEAAVARREVIAARLPLLLRDIGRVDTLLSTCEASLPTEGAADESDVRGAIADARRKLSKVFADAEGLQD
jgi:hypothetical protein